MIRIILGATLVFMLLFSNSYACHYHPRSGDDLYQVFNHFFLEGAEQGALNSDIELLNSSYFISNDQDTQLWSTGDVLRVDATYSDALFWQELGYISGDDYVTVLEHSGIDKREYAQQEAVFTVSEDFTLSDTIGLYGDDPLQRWYADAEMNPLGAKDHFLAFAIDDNDLLAVFNDQFDTYYQAGVDDVWMIAFEDLNLGDADYTDLVAVIARSADVNAVPIPGTGLLMAGAIAGLAGIRRRQLKRS